MEAKVFTNAPNELKTLEVDVEKKIFNINGVPFGEGCTGFTIGCDASEGYKITMEIDTTVIFNGYGLNGKKHTDHTFKKHSQ